MDIQQGNANQPSTAVVTKPVPESGGLRTAGGQCIVVPASALRGVKQTRKASIFVIVIHSFSFCLYFFLAGGGGYWPWPTPLVLISTMIACTMGGVLLCSFSKRVYRTAAVFFALGAVVDFGLLFVWSYVVHEINERNRTNGDEDYDIPTGYFAILIIPAVLSSLGFLMASVFAFKTVCNWPRGGDLPENQDQNTPPV